jgi:Tat protein secretion system quality control protein TatD with DNase activity
MIGPTMDTLKAVREKYNWRFSQINVDIHSAGGWSPQFWKQAEKQFPNLYASPSILITSRTQTAPDLIRAISKDRILVESDSHDVRRMTQLVWAATKWIAGCRGWKVEDGNIEWNELSDDSQPEDQGEIWAVKTLERNMASFLKIGDDPI